MAGYVQKTVIYRNLSVGASDDNEMIKGFISGELTIDHPLFKTNESNGCQFSVEDRPIRERIEMITEVMSWLIDECTLFFAQYGAIGIDYRIVKRYCRSKYPQIYCFDYYSPTSDPEWWEYWNNNISYIRMKNEEFKVHNFVSDIMRSKGDTNDYFLLVPEKSSAISVYDCRGMDLVSTDKELIQMAREYWERMQIKQQK